MKKLENPTGFFFKQADLCDSSPHKDIEDFVATLIDYQKCPLCKQPYHLKEEGKIPRILVHCGHTFCSRCLQQFYMNRRVRCPMCLKLIKKLHCIKALPINHSVMTQLAVQDQKGAKLTSSTAMMADPARFLYSEFIRQSAANANEQSPAGTDDETHLPLCVFHPDRVQHFFCMHHENPGCRKCMEEAHGLASCRVLDLYEIRKSSGDEILRDIETEINSLNV